ncbi:MAG TPA: glutaminyl-peptide cyclotransferase [Kofleriaceae bacterium]
MSDARQGPDDPPLSPAIVVGALPHDRTAFTQGLAFWQGRLFEGTGLYGESVVRELDPDSGRELRRAALDAKYFGEGITILNGRLYQLTWQEHRCLVYDPASFNRLDELTYEGEGWGLTNDGKSLIMSDGSEWIRYRDAASFKVTRSIRVTLAGRPVQHLNELEYIHDEIWANVWYSDVILRISPADGHVVAILDASKILDSTLRSGDANDVLNGIAFDASSGSLLLTGKRWLAIYKVALPQ